MKVVSFFAPRFDKFGCDYDELLMLLDKSCKKLYFTHVVISDEPRPYPLNTHLTHLPENLMQAFLYGQLNVLRETNEPVLFTGADCLLIKDPRNCFITDLTVTISPTFSDCEMNTGAIFIKNPKSCIEIWKKALDAKPLDWGDDQRCLYKAIRESDMNIAYLSCEDHNWAPNDINDDAGMPTIVHFRGKRKSFMKDWAEKYLGIN